MSLWSKLPDDIVKLIYEYDTTYREIMNGGLKFIGTCQLVAVMVVKKSLQTPL